MYPQPLLDLGSLYVSSFNDFISVLQEFLFHLSFLSCRKLAVLFDTVPSSLEICQGLMILIYD